MRGQKLDERGRWAVCLVLCTAACAEQPASPSENGGRGGAPTGVGAGEAVADGGISQAGAAGATAGAGVGGAPSAASAGGASSAGGAPAGAGISGGDIGGSTGGAGVAGDEGQAGTNGGGTEPGAGGPSVGGLAGGGGAGGSGAGMAGAANAGSGGSSTGDGFTLVFRDDFDTLDLGRWQLMTHSWDTNLALFSASAASVESGLLRLTLTPAPSGTVDDVGNAKSFLGAEVRSRDTVPYGRVRARARLAQGSAVVSALVTIYTPWPADDWNELDIECLGSDPSNVQFNAMVYTGPPTTPPVSTSVSPTQHPTKVELGFDSSADYHVFTIEWTPEGARFLVDDAVRHTWTERIDLFGLEQNVLLTIWASSSPEWAGPITNATGQASASYDWVELYRFTP